MKKQIENIKKQYKNETKKIVMVVLGFVSGAAIAKGISMLAEKFPDYEKYLTYSKAPLLGASGWLICNASDTDAVLTKHFGYGVSASAALEGIRIIPIAKDFLDGVGNNMQKTYYTEGDQLQLGSFGLNSLPVKSIEMGEVQPIQIDLPELDAERRSGDLGYNKDQTSDADNMKGII